MKTCETCKYFRRGGNAPSYCHRNPIAVTVAEDYWCGEHAPSVRGKHASERGKPKTLCVASGCYFPHEHLGPHSFERCNTQDGSDRRCVYFRGHAGYCAFNRYEGTSEQTKPSPRPKSRQAVWEEWAIAAIRPLLHSMQPTVRAMLLDAIKYGFECAQTEHANAAAPLDRPFAWDCPYSDSRHGAPDDCPSCEAAGGQ